ncbi:MAG: inositol monophosphatase family protein [Actinomycetota bacterium]
MPVPLSDLLASIRAAVRAACSLCLAVGDPERLEKKGREPVTLADYGSQAILLRAAALGFPEDRVVAEEGSAQLLAAAGADGIAEIAGLVGAALGQRCTSDDVVGWIDREGGTGSRTWAVDPIDGTKGFLRGDQFAVAVGILDYGVPVAGVLGCPRFEIGGATGVVLWGGPSIGAFVEPLIGGSGTRVAVSEVAGPEGTRVLGSVEVAHGDPALVREVIDRVGLGGGWVRIDSQVKYAAVAAGMAEVYLRPRSREDWRERIWDHAAGVAIVEGAGGRVTDLDGKPLDFTFGPTLAQNRGVLVTNGRVHDLVLEALRLG